MPIGETAGGGFEPVGPEIVGGHVDEVAPRGDRLGDGGDLGRVDAVGRHQPDRLCGFLAVAREDATAEQPASVARTGSAGPVANE